MIKIEERKHEYRITIILESNTLGMIIYKEYRMWHTKYKIGYLQDIAEVCRIKSEQRSFGNCSLTDAGILQRLLKYGKINQEDYLQLLLLI